MAEWPLSAPEYVRLDLFPAYVTRKGESGPYTERARVIITDKDFYVFLDSVNGPACDLSGVLYDASGNNRDGYDAELDSGEVLHVSRSSNCGCGSRLRGFRPFPGIPFQTFAAS